MEGSGETQRPNYIGRDYMGIEPAGDRPLSEADVQVHRDLAIGNLCVALGRLASVGTAFLQAALEEEQQRGR